MEAGFLTRDCQWPILDLQLACDDQFVKNMPTFFGRWKDGITQRAVTSVRPIITIPESLTKCEYATVNTQATGCKWLVPNMVSVRFTPEEAVSWDEAVEEFCEGRPYEQGVHSLLTRSGLDLTADPIGGMFARFMLAGLSQGMMEHLEGVAMNGVYGNVLEFDGWYTQLTSGWGATADYVQSCDVFNTAVTLNWATLTGGTPGTPVPPDAVIDAAHDSITMWGIAFAGFEGMNYGEFALRFLEIVEESFASRFGGVTQWEWVLPHGQKRCLRELLACIQPCDGSGALTDTELRDRFADYYTRDLVQIYPSDTPIMLQQSRGLTDTAVLGPRMIGDRYTYGWTFRNMDEVVRNLRGLFGQIDYMTGKANWNHPLVNQSLDNLRANFETLAFLHNITYDDLGRCITPTLETWPGMLVFGRHMFLVMNDITCEPVAAIVCDDESPVLGPMTIELADCTDDTPSGSEVTRLILELAEDPNHTPVAADQVAVLAGDGTWVPFDVVSWSTPNLTVASDTYITDCATLAPTYVVV